MNTDDRPSHHPPDGGGLDPISIRIQSHGFPTPFVPFILTLKGTVMRQLEKFILRIRQYRNVRFFSEIGFLIKDPKTTYIPKRGRRLQDRRCRR
jgi:hypothetical protein